ncbi:hypothetical protein PG985_015554 [Apiospora marii]|uniref:uncharacterized protein n=1 Tax=Apiospora marii TaxID=335849 RepID=UPI003132358E
MVVYCAYCGKQFTRKVHKSYLTGDPASSHVANRSLFYRSILSVTYQFIPTSSRIAVRAASSHSQEGIFFNPALDTNPGAPPTVVGKQPIACLNCAQAKPYCEWEFPQTKLIRESTRSSKAALRAAAALQNQTPVPQVTVNTTMNPAFMDLDGGMKQDSIAKPMVSPNAISTIDPRIQQGESPHTHKNDSPANSHPGTESNFPSPHAKVDLDELMLGSDFLHQDHNYNDMLVWPEYSLDLNDMYPATNLPLGTTDVPMPPFAEMSDASSNSEQMSSSRGSIHTRSTSTSIMSNGEYEPTVKPTDVAVSSPNDTADLEVVLAAEAAWPLARCTPPVYSGTCPRTAIVHLESLEQKSKQENTWDTLERYLEQVDWDAADLASVVPLQSRTRDNMLAITQTFLHKALEIHRGGLSGYNKDRFSGPGLATFLVLPPSKILEYFLRSYVRSLSFFYSLVSTGCVDPNEMVQNNKASTLLVLLMIAQGASAVPTAEARALSAGLVETCRISLFDIIEKDIEMCADPITVRCSLLFTLLGAWSGDKWLMDISLGQRGMYLSMLKHAGMLDAQPAMIPNFHGSLELQWRDWLARETQNRLVYNWVMVDQELSLFHDTAPILNISELCAPLPGPDLLWMSANAEQWQQAMQSLYGCTANVNPQLLNTPSLSPSLYDVFQDFLHENLSRRQSTLSAHQLRLLLHPLQSLLCHLRQMLSCFSDVLSTRRTASRTVTKASTMLRLEEVQALLQSWYELSIAVYNSNPSCSVSKTNLVLYHLISLNAVTNFPEIERLARREGFDGSYWELSLRHKRCIYQREESIFHCGQVLRLIRTMPVDRRPTWWSAALYRAALILWTDSVSRLDPNFQKRDEGSLVAIDQVTPEDPAVIAYLWNGDGIPVLSRGDGSTTTLDTPTEVLLYAAKSIDEGVSCRLSDGIKRKLLALGNNWRVDGLTSTSV